MNLPTPQRVRIIYSKTGSLRFIGHLDTQRLFERALRRSGFPLRYSQGFAPKIRINLAGALPLGFISRAEVLDFWLDEPLDTADIQSRLQAALPADIRVSNVTQVDNSLPALQASLLSSTYHIDLPQGTPPGELLAKLDTLLAQPQVLVERRKKTVNILPMIEALSLQKQDGKPELNLTMSSTPEANGRPDELLVLLDLDPADCLVERTAMRFQDWTAE